MITLLTPLTNPFTYIPAGADWLRALPELILVGTALVVLLADLPRMSDGRAEANRLMLISVLGVVAALAATGGMFIAGDGQTAFYGMITSDWLSLLADLVILVSVGAGLLYSPGYIERQGIEQAGEYYALMLIAGSGMMLMAAAANLMMIFVGLEVFSLALYVLCAYIHLRFRSQEAGLKYFILSSFASAFLLYGMALTYGATNSTSLAGIGAAIGGAAFHATSGYGPLLIAGLGLMAVGFSFKVSAIPFQAWAPDVYVGAPTTVTAFMSVGTKVAAFVALARVFMVALHALQPQWMPVFWAVAVLTMVGGNILAVTQRNVKRMLAYSSVANAGYMLVAVVTGTRLSLASLMVYLAVYGAMNLGAFGVVLALERDNGMGTSLDDYAGLARGRPLVAAAMAVFMFALAGIPPTAGFAGKWYIFYAAIAGGHLELALIGLIASLLGMFYYLRVVWAMYFSEPRPMTETSYWSSPPMEAALAHCTSLDVLVNRASGRATGAVAVAEPELAPPASAPKLRQAGADASAPSTLTPGTTVALVIAVVLTLALGIAPGPLYQAATQAASVLLK